eukprot:m.111160 g.111160  ORF g.111160 m.111160 type:complete len:114 (-) comp13435_c0_seq1:805-1146(-)
MQWHKVLLYPPPRLTRVSHLASLFLSVTGITKPLLDLLSIRCSFGVVVHHCIILLTRTCQAHCTFTFCFSFVLQEETNIRAAKLNVVFMKEYHKSPHLRCNTSTELRNRGDNR